MEQENSPLKIIELLVDPEAGLDVDDFCHEVTKLANNKDAPVAVEINRTKVKFFPGTTTEAARALYLKAITPKSKK